MENVVSFTRQVKDELCLLPYNEERDRSLLSAFIRASGYVVLSNKQEKVVLKTENSNIAKYIYNLIKKMYPDVVISFSYRKMMNLNKNTQYIINLSDNVQDLLKGLEIDFLETKIPFVLSNSNEKIIGYLTGIFLSSGSVNSPQSSNYHLEMYTNDESFSLAILKVIKKVKINDFSFRMTKRRNNYVLYLKKSDKIADFLGFLDANNACLNFENIRIDRDFANVGNRLINMDTSNYKKTIDKSAKQIEDINVIDKSLGIKNIVNDKIRELCFLRLENKEATYQNLADLLGEKTKKTVSKSNINHLFIKIHTMAEDFRYGKRRL
ncbi:MAG: DNA-binding protein WhiA [Bacilli bacterium]